MGVAFGKPVGVVFRWSKGVALDLSVGSEWSVGGASVECRRSVGGMSRRWIIAGVVGGLLLGYIVGDHLMSKQNLHIETTEIIPGLPTTNKTLNANT